MGRTQNENKSMQQQPGEDFTSKQLELAEAMDIVARLRARALEMLDWPPFEMRTSKNGKTTILKPVWTFDDLEKAIRLTVELNAAVLKAVKCGGFVELGGDSSKSHGTSPRRSKK